MEKRKNSNIEPRPQSLKQQLFIMKVLVYKKVSFLHMKEISLVY